MIFVKMTDCREWLKLLQADLLQLLKCAPWSQVPIVYIVFIASLMCYYLLCPFQTLLVFFSVLGKNEAPRITSTDHHSTQLRQ